MNDNHNGTPVATPAVQPYPFIGPVTLLPAPVQMEVALGVVATNDGKRLIALQIATASGVSTYFIEQDRAAGLGRALQQLGGGIEVVPTGSPLARSFAERKKR